MKKTLKILALILALAMTLCVLTACGGDDKKDDKKDEPATEETAPAAEEITVDFSQYDLTAIEEGNDWSEGSSSDGAKFSGMLDLNKRIKAGELEGKVISVSGKLTIKDDATEVYQQNGAGGKATVPFKLVDGELPEAGKFIKITGVVLGDKAFVPADQLSIIE